MNKIDLLIRIVKNISNWPIYLLDFFKLAGKGKINYRLRNGVKHVVRGGTFDWSIINEVWNHHDYTPPGFEINKGSTIIDIGAHAGIFSVFAAYHAKNGRVFSFEPVPENYNMMLENIRLNGYDNITPINMAVSDEAGDSVIFLSGHNTGGHSLINRTPDNTKKVEIKCDTLESVVNENKIDTIDFLKLDCEGAEFKILFNSSDAVIDKIQTISMEYHNLDDDNNVNTLQSFLESKGFDVSVSTGKSRMLYAKRLKKVS